MTASIRVAVSFVSLCTIACSADPTSPTARGPATAGKPSSTATAGTGAASGGAAGSGWSSTTDAGVSIRDSGTISPPDAGTDAAVVDENGCEEGKFCAPTVPDPDNCGTIELKSDVETVLRPGNVLVVFDRSGSMDGDWNGTPKYQAAGNALIAAITPLQDTLTVGGIFFPSADTANDPNCPDGCNAINPLHWIPGPGACCLNGVSSSCVVNTIDKPDQIDFGPAATFISGLPNQWRLTGASGTPLETGIARAAEAIAGKQFSDPLSVIVMTDGEPTCDSRDQPVIDQLTAWKTAGISTYVVGLPGAQGAAELLNTMASAGGTDKYIDPTDPQQLETRLRSVISSTVRQGFDSCTFHLDPKADAPDKLHLIVTQNGKESDVARDLGKDSSWKINAAGDQVDLSGQLCDAAKAGDFEGVRFVFGCVEVPPYVPPEIF